MDSLEIEKQLNMSYSELVEYLLRKYGKSKYNYFIFDNYKSINQKVSRAKEGLFCHHIDEDKAIMLSSRDFAKKNPFEYQKADRLVYCNILEHLILHIKITLEPRHPQANQKETPGFGGIKLITRQLNDYFNGYEIKREYLKNAMQVIENNFNDYIKVLRFFIKELIQSKDILVNITRNRIRLVRGLSSGYKRTKNTVYDYLIIPDEEDLISIDELTELESLAASGSEDAMVKLAVLYEKGDKVGYSLEKAFNYYQKASKLNSIEAIWAVGFYYYNGLGVFKDINKALECFIIVAKDGYDLAEYYAGLCYLDEECKKKNIDEAIKWFKLSANQGHLPSQLKLGDIYYNVFKKYKKNVLEAISWYELASNQKSSIAFLELGKIYLNGIGISKDLEKSEKYLKKSEKLGNLLAKELRVKIQMK